MFCTKPWLRQKNVHLRSVKMCSAVNQVLLSSVTGTWSDEGRGAGEAGTTCTCLTPELNHNVSLMFVALTQTQGLGSQKKKKRSSLPFPM